MNSITRCWSDWKPLAGPSTCRNSPYSLGVSVASTAHCETSCAWMCLTRARILKLGSNWSRRTNASAARSSWRISLNQSSLVWCWMMNSISSWWGGVLRGFCAASSLSSWRYPPYVIRSRKSVTTLSSGHMADLLSPCYPRRMRRAAALLLFCCACDEPPAGPQTLPGAGLVTVSGTAPWNSSACRGPAGPGGVAFPNAEVEPYAAVNPGNAKHLIGIWQQDRWSNGGASGLVTAATFDGGHTWTTSFARLTKCSGGTFQRASDPWVAISPNGTAYQIGF